MSEARLLDVGEFENHPCRRYNDRYRDGRWFDYRGFLVSASDGWATAYDLGGKYFHTDGWQQVLERIDTYAGARAVAQEMLNAAHLDTIGEPFVVDSDTDPLLCGLTLQRHEGGRKVVIRPYVYIGKNSGDVTSYWAVHCYISRYEKKVTPDEYRSRGGEDTITAACQEAIDWIRRLDVTALDG